MKRKWVALLAVAMLFAFAAGAVAGPTLQEISAYLATDIQFNVDGKAWAPKDADGSALYPVVYNDRTYLPARAIGEALGVKVDWNNDTRTVILGKAAPAPVKEDPKEEPKEEPKAAGPVAISPASVDFNKNNLADIPVNVTWGEATKVTEIKGVALGGALKLDLKEGSEYTIQDNGDGTAVLTIKKELTKLLPIAIEMVPDNTVLTLTIKFDKGEKTFDIKVVS